MPRDRFVGFYWTLPVFTHGFRALPDDAEEAARRSRTIRHQRDIVHAWVAEEGGVIEPGDEAVFLENDPDHGTGTIVPEVEKLLRRCQREDKQLLVVALWEMEDMGWRRHHRLIELLDAEEQAAAAEGRDPLCFALLPDPGRDRRAIRAMLDNFAQWRDTRAAFTAGKPDREALLLRVVEELKETGGAKASSAILAQALNEAGHPSQNGRPWTAANLRQFLRRQKLRETEARRPA